MLVENHETVVRLDFLLDYDARFAEVLVCNEFDQIHSLRHLDESTHVLLSQML